MFRADALCPGEADSIHETDVIQQLQVVIGFVFQFAQFLDTVHMEKL